MNGIQQFLCNLFLGIIVILLCNFIAIYVIPILRVIWRRIVLKYNQRKYIKYQLLILKMCIKQIFLVQDMSDDNACKFEFTKKTKDNLKKFILDLQKELYIPLEHQYYQMKTRGKRDEMNKEVQHPDTETN